MTSKNLFTFNAIVCFLFAIPLLTIPSQFLSQYMIGTDQLGRVGKAVSRAYGGMILALGIALWMGRNAEKESLARKILIWYVLIGNTCALVAYLVPAVNGSLTSMIYTSIVLVAVLAIWAVLLMFKK